MGRTIITEQDIRRFFNDLDQDEADSVNAVGIAPLDPSPEAQRRGVIRPDSYAEKLVKYIPSEVVATYLALDLACRASAEPWVGWAVFVFGFFATPLYLWRMLQVRKWIQLAVSTLAFAIWAFALGGPFTKLWWYKPIYPALILPMFTFLMPLIAPANLRSDKPAE